MTDGGIDQEEAPVGKLFSRLVDEGKAYAHAEIDLIKATTEVKVDAAKRPALLGAAALLFLQAGVIVLCMTIALALATLIGPLAGGLIATLFAFTIAGLLGLLAKREWDSRR
ncbi:MAG: phage holin family protein [Sphingomonas sp.]|uniref:phage holin family protein n=1 Tax=Sphingomonas sp. TaxID=28214 RepID=UPI001792BB68|nr:phage holin family protein [Sphingomonas sp.]MBA3667799.1 phage holin family protein [Sphingomonas sp.]